MGSRSKGPDKDKPGPVREQEVDLLIGHLRLNAMPRSAAIVERMWIEIQIYRRDFAIVKKEST